MTAGQHSIAVPLTLGSNVDLAVAAGARLTMSGGAGGAKGLTKSGSGLLDILGVNDYTGATIAAAGTLKINGVLTSSSVGVEGAATLMGSGTIGGSVLVRGTHSPGNSPGIQTVEGGLTYEANATVVWELIANTLLDRGTNFDGINVAGGLAFGDPTNLALTFDLPGSTVDWSSSFWGNSYTGTDGWLVYEGADSLAGFANLAISGTNWMDGQGYQLQTERPGATFATYQDGTDVYLTYVVAVPEPTAAGLGGAAAVCGLGLAWLRRRNVTRRMPTPM